MPDWRDEVLRRLAQSKLSSAEREEIARELAGYLEDHCQDARRAGLTESAAVQAAFAELDEDKNLGAHLYRARKEHPMNLNRRTRQFWLPAVTLFLGSAFLLAAFQACAVLVYRAYAPNPGVAHSYPGLIHNLLWHDSAALMFYLAWLYSLPFVGAAGGYWSRREGGGRSVRLAAGLFPVLLFTAVFFSELEMMQKGNSLPFLAVDGLPPAHLFFPFLSPVASLFLSWTLIPGAALFLGVLPFLRRATARRDAAASAI
ncbi:MAG: hypothetical protein WBQ34_08640 [Candidatus Acidiferrales bacterium]